MQGLQAHQDLLSDPYSNVLECKAAHDVHTQELFRCAIGRDRFQETARAIANSEQASSGQKLGGQSAHELLRYLMGVESSHATTCRPELRVGSSYHVIEDYRVNGTEPKRWPMLKNGTVFATSRHWVERSAKSIAS
jgi:hypothetical protein